jgi:hypothetical protein
LRGSWAKVPPLSLSLEASSARRESEYGSVAGRDNSRGVGGRGAAVASGQGAGRAGVASGLYGTRGRRVRFVRGGGGRRTVHRPEELALPLACRWSHSSPVAVRGWAERPPLPRLL